MSRWLEWEVYSNQENSISIFWKQKKKKKNCVFWLLREPCWPEFRRRTYWLLDITRWNWSKIFRWYVVLLIYHSWLCEGQHSDRVWMPVSEDVNNTFSSRQTSLMETFPLNSNISNFSERLKHNMDSLIWYLDQMLMTVNFVLLWSVIFLIKKNAFWLSHLLTFFFF